MSAAAPIALDVRAKFKHLAAVYRKWLYSPDLGLLEFVVGSIVANGCNADPIWPMVIGGPGSGKSETLRALSGLPSLYEASVITEAGLLSAVPKKDRSDNATGGLLRQIGFDTGFVVLKDFGSVLSMNRDARASLLAAMREIYDGAWTRRVGADGGIELKWTGKVAFICGSTNAIDLHHGAMASLGERFTYYRTNTNTADRSRQGETAIEHIGQTNEMRKELSAAMCCLLNPLPPVPPVGELLKPNEKKQILALADLATMARSAVERDPYKRDIIQVSEPESPTRLSVTLTLLLGGMTAIGVESKEAWRVVRKVALDSIPPVRRAALEVLLKTKGKMTLLTVIKQARLKCSEQTVRRTLEELSVHGIIDSKVEIEPDEERRGTGKTCYEATRWAREKYRNAGFEDA